MSGDILIDKQREQKLKFVEILLIVGGIIASLGVKDENFGYFLIFSLIYYLMLSDMPFTGENSRALVFISIPALFVAFYFSCLAVSSIEFSDRFGFSSIYMKNLLIFLTVVLIYVNLLPAWLVPHWLKDCIKTILKPLF